MLNRIRNEDDQAWIERIKEELLQAELRIEQQTGQSHKYLAYPYGEFDTAIKQLLTAEGFTGIAQNSGALGFNSDFLALPRYPLAGNYADIESVKTKLSTLSFNVSQQTPNTPITSDHSPSVILKFADGNYNLQQIGCFANSQAIPMHWLDQEQGLVELTPLRTFPGRRWRYICTAPDIGSSRYHWFSVQWIDPSI